MPNVDERIIFEHGGIKKIFSLKLLAQACDFLDPLGICFCGRHLGILAPITDEFLYRSELVGCDRKKDFRILPVSGGGWWAIGIVDFVFGDREELPEVLLRFNRPFVHDRSGTLGRSLAAGR